MKRLSFLLGLVLSFNTLYAQYFQHTYGNKAGMEVESENSQSIPVSNGGYVMTGARTDLTKIHIIRTNDQGNIVGASAFNKYVNIVVNMQGSAPASATSVTEVKIPGDVEFVFAGGVLVGNSIVPYILKTNAKGDVLFTQYYSLMINNPYQCYDIKIKTSRDNTTLYLSGTVEDDDHDTFPFAISLAANTGNVNWGYRYIIAEHDRGMDNIEDPYLDPNKELIIVGQSNDLKGLFITINAANGHILTSSKISVTNNEQWFKNIRQATSTMIPDAFIIGGSATIQDGGTTDAWTVVMNKQRNFDFSTVHDDQNQPNTCNEIVQLMNGNNQPEYYTSGTLHRNNATPVIQVLKINEQGQAVNNQGFHYGRDDRRSYGLSINLAQTGGLSISGITTPNTKAQQLLINAYKNGLTACNFWPEEIQSREAPPQVIDIVPGDLDLNPQLRPMEFQSEPALNKIECFQQTIMGGSNMKQSNGVASTIAFNELRVYPNPATAEVIFSGLNQNENTTIAITDITGREVYRSKQLTGVSSINIDLNILNAGVYFFSMTDNTGVVSKGKLIITD